MSKQTSMTKTVKKYITEHCMLQAESHILVALSGGADSVCLLCVLKELEQDLGITVSALHVHHGIRGAEADRDADFCKELCVQLNVPCQLVFVDVPAMAAEQKMSLEEAARMVRYQELEGHRQQLAKQYCGGEVDRVRIAVAHHREDQAETVLWNLFRGSGLKGMGGMTPVNGAVIRPLLEVSKAEILDNLRQQGLLWQQDSTNDSDDYTRNRIRHHILGYATEHINEGSAEHICQTAKLAAQADAYLQKQATRWLEAEQNRTKRNLCENKYGERTGFEQDGCGSVRVSRLVQEEELLQNYILRALLGQWRNMTDVTIRHLDAMRGLLTEITGGSAQRQIELGEGLTVYRSYDELWVQPVEKVMDVTVDTVREPMEVELPEIDTWKEVHWGGKTFLLRVISYEKTQKIPTNQYTKWINYDTLDKMLVFRTRQVGDYIMLPGGGRKTVKSYMIDEKIPAGERDRIPVIAQGSHVLWIAGYRLSEGAKVTGDTRYILEIQMHGG